MNAIKNPLFHKIQEGFLWALLACPVPQGFWDTEIFNLPEKNKEKLILAIQPEGLDSYRRERLAELLQAIKPKTETIQRKLYINLAETQAASELILENPSLEDRLERARILTRWNRNKAVLDTLDEKLESCEASYLRSLAYRRLREYKNAKEALKKTIRICDGNFKQKALFLNARIAAMKSSDDAIEVLDDFIEKYPDASYADDVLLWKAHVLTDLDRDSEAADVLETIIKKYPTGDMYEQAVFERAFAFASEPKNISKALKYLESLSTPQSLYWQGRLRLYPELKQLVLNPNLEEQAKAKRILSDLAKEFPQNYYGYFAARLIGDKKVQKPQEFQIPKSSILGLDPTYSILKCFKKQQYTKEAVWIVDRLSKQYKSLIERFNLAQEYIDLGRPDKAHQLMRDSGLAFPRKRSDNFPWVLSFPKAYEVDFQKASQQEKIPIDWLMGECREESKFDAHAISWAGAVGLCQLMPSTAHVSTTKLLNPEKNIEIAAAHLRGLDQDLSHPLKVIAAYNAGKGAIKRWDREQGPVPMDVWVEQIPYAQTRDYVKKVAESWLTYSWLSGRLKNNFYSLENLPLPGY